MTDHSGACSTAQSAARTWGGFAIFLSFYCFLAGSGWQASGVAGLLIGSFGPVSGRLNLRLQSLVGWINPRWVMD